ncbi:ABC transporter permease [Mycetocola lacteus]|uniref:ABC transporter permease n=1 Tax=Mycetocola lacteus TaxID=76637 RepID=A0A3L7AL81_9MICO|nr:MULTISPECIES: ABC transporter permease [Mycetocola]MCS4275492.1 peptide/nickel transport system permease protein [Mycetocola sp. BIGb0189]RLP80814.1 ABC transporter permease [Mycetocola lacteus]RLP84599.1 ABC transporter permease [Mycetocola lacteus]
MTQTTNSPEGAPAAAVAPAEVKGKSQGQLIFSRFLENRISVVSIFLLLALIIFAFTSVGFGPIPGWWKHNYRDLNDLVNGGAATLSVVPKWLGGSGIQFGDHPFGQSRIGVDYFAMTMRGIQNSVVVMLVIGGVGTVVGTVVGAIAGYYRGWVDAVLMRITDIFIVIPAIVIGAVVGSTANNAGSSLGVWILAILLGLVSWMGIARLVRAEFLSLREREFVEAARVAGASDARIIFRHILPNAVGVVIVSATLLAASAILLETGLSYLGFGIKSPDVSLGLLISDNQSAFATRPWLYWWPGAFIVVLALLVNFIGDGLRDAFDPRQKRFKLSRKNRAAESK